MLYRRNFLKTMGLAAAGTGLTGCGVIRDFFQPQVSRTAIDIHTHFFNGRDVPIVGFLKQVILRDPHAPVDPDMTTDAFLKLLKNILLIDTPTAAEELADFGGPVTPMDPAEIEARDERNVAAGIAQFQQEAGRQTAGLRTTQSQESALLDRLAEELNATSLRSGLQTPQVQANGLAARIYQTTKPAGLTQDTPGEDRTYVHLSPLMQTIRWVGLLTRPRREILAELNRLYGGENFVRIFSPSLVDFSAWFVTQEEVTPLEDQIALTAAIARRNTDALILPFAPFCPLRAALEREDDPTIDPLRIVKRAVLELGFLGVKLYPPMGFRPIGNNTDLTWVPRKPRDGPSALDRELKALYTWCIENEVPLKAHANNSLAAGPDTGAFADPAGWQTLMRDPQFSALQLNLAHFGGFDESAPARQFPDPSDWEETMVDMVAEFPNFYFDLGYWTAALDAEDGERDRVIARTKALLARAPQMTDRMMYGSDWSMIGRVPGHPTYLAKAIETFDVFGFSEEQVEQIMGGNAASYLGIDRAGPQRDRMDQVYADHPIFQDIF